MARICSSNFSSDARTGATMPSIACCCAAWRASASIVVCSRTAPSRSLASVRKSSWLARSVSCASAANVSASCDLAPSISARSSWSCRASPSARAVSAARRLSASRSGASIAARARAVASSQPNAPATSPPTRNAAIPTATRSMSGHTIRLFRLGSINCSASPCVVRRWRVASDFQLILKVSGGGWTARAQKFYTGTFQWRTAASASARRITWRSPRPARPRFTARPCSRTSTWSTARCPSAPPPTSICRRRCSGARSARR